MKFKLTNLLLCLAVAAPMSMNAANADVLDHSVKSIEGKEVNLETYKGKVLLVVNVASKCGYTKQYAGLEEISKEYKDKGLVVMGFPCNQFGGQEPGTDKQIQEFCSATYKVDFDMFSKVDVNTKSASPFFKELTAVDVPPKGAGPVKWNFEKFVIGKDGTVLARFPSATTPNDPALVAVIEKALAAE